MGTALAIPIVLLVVIGLAIGSVFNFATGFLAIPIVGFLMLNWVLASDAIQRQRRIHKMRQFRNSARAQKITPTEQDKRTLV